jgi:hypothetical protein
VFLVILKISDAMEGACYKEFWLISHNEAVDLVLLRQKYASKWVFCGC